MAIYSLRQWLEKHNLLRWIPVADLIKKGYTLLLDLSGASYRFQMKFPDNEAREIFKGPSTAEKVTAAVRYMERKGLKVVVSNI